jgi:hypothetical protein
VILLSFSLFNWKDVKFIIEVNQVHYSFNEVFVFKFVEFGAVDPGIFTIWRFFRGFLSYWPKSA